MTRRLLVAAGFWLASALACPDAAQAAIPVPPPTGYVVDTARALPADRAAALEARLKDLEARKGSQVVVVVVPTTGDEPIEQFALRVAEAWKPGRKKVDDGAVLVVATADHAVRIEVGYGLEGALNDATAHRIIDEVIVPRIRGGDLAGGIEAGVDRVIGVIDGEPLPAAPQQAAGQGDAEQWPPYMPILVVVTLALAAILPAILGRLGGSVATGGVVAAVAWWLGGLSIALLAGALAAAFTLVGGIGLLAMIYGGHRRGSGGSFGGGGGFRGGGGGFGGGGASGRW